MTPWRPPKAASGDQNHPMARVAVSQVAVGVGNGRIFVFCDAFVDVTVFGSSTAARPTRDSPGEQKRIAAVGAAIRVRQCIMKRIRRLGGQRLARLFNIRRAIE